MLWFLVLTASVLYLFYNLFIKRSLCSRLGIPEDPGLPVIGSVLPLLLGKMWNGDLWSLLYKKFEGYPYFGYRSFWTTVIMIRDPKLISILFKHEFKIFNDHGVVISSSVDPLTLNVFHSKGERWRWLRGKLTPTFSPNSIKNMFPYIHTSAEKTTEGLVGTRNLRFLTDEFSIRVISYAVFGVDDYSGFIEHTRCVFKFKGVQGIRLWLNFLNPRLKEIFKPRFTPPEVEAFFREALKKSERRPGGFLDQLYKIKEEDPAFTDDYILSHFFLFALGGFETTSTTLMFCLYLLSKHPVIQTKARHEVEEIIRNQTFSYDSIGDMNFLEAVIKETLRLYPPGASLFRLNEVSYKLPCGAVIPKGTRFAASISGLHRDPKYYPDPDVFIPERFLYQSFDENVFIPFGVGPRKCLGMKFAILEMKAFLSVLLYNYEFKLNEKTVEPFQPVLESLFLDTKHPFYCDFTPINRN